MNINTIKRGKCIMAIGKIYAGLTVLGGALGGIYGIVHYLLGDVSFITVIIIGAIAGLALGLVCDGVIETLKNK